MGLVLGIDEAGKGPVIGSMFVAGVVIRENRIQALRKLGVKNSKLLTKHMRNIMFNLVKTYAEKIYVREVKPEIIDKTNINNILLGEFLNIIRDALEEFNGKIKLVIIDLPSISPNKVKQAIMLLGFRGNIVVEHFADKKYVAVSAASIVAKTYREKHIGELKKIYGDFGSGYPSDVKTVSWIKDFYRKEGYLPPIVRKSWKTIREIAPTEYVEKKKR
ncbi:MAG: ribonuclease HII [Thermoprotei archaeon]|nr:MAG: ribonuclease HII [Thermoprotei archaeon]